MKETQPLIIIKRRVRNAVVQIKAILNFPLKEKLNVKTLLIKYNCAWRLCLSFSLVHQQENSLFTLKIKNIRKSNNQNFIFHNRAYIYIYFHSNKFDKFSRSFLFSVFACLNVCLLLLLFPRLFILFELNFYYFYYFFSLLFCFFCKFPFFILLMISF